MRDVARQAFIQTLGEISIPRVFAQKIEYARGVLRIGDDLYNLASYGRVLVVAIGKAAHTMLESLSHQVGPRLEGIVVCSEPPRSQQPAFRYFLGGHPLPTEESIRGARAILKYLSGLTDDALVIYLISGGASAMLELPNYDDEISLEDIVRTYRTLILSGAAIGEINAIRKHLSAVKGGRLAQAAYPARQVSIMISDVPEHSLDALASGPTMPDPSTVEDCYRIAERHGLKPQFPESVRTLFEQRALEETAKSDDPAFVNARWWPILSSSSAAQAAANLISKQGFAVEIDNTPDDWPYESAADYLLNRVRELRKGASRVALVSAGEITVKVSGGGVGGRNQHFALYCAQKVAGESLTVLSAGTDGIDGNSPAAGAVADGTTIERARALGTDPMQILKAFDSFSLLKKLGDVVVTGPTGNNLRDVRIVLSY